MDANASREHEQIRTFIKATGQREEVARKFLTESVWDINLATSNFFDSDYATSNYAPPPAQKKPFKPRVGGFGSLGSTEESDNGENKYYTGGKQSGIQVQDRPEEKSEGIVDKIFKKTSDPIPERVEEKHFGSGHKLGNAETPSIAIRDEPEPEQKPILITFWKQGFVVDEGALRRYADPANKNFLRDIEKGVVPTELHTRMNRNSKAVAVNLVDKKTTDYEEPTVAQPKMASFSGTAHKLGDSSTLPAVVSTPSTEDLPGGKARVQVRLVDGKPLRLTLGMDQTVGDLRKLINQNKPQNKPYILLIPHPRAVLSDPNQTIRQADLNNASIIQRYQ